MENIATGNPVTALRERLGVNRVEFARRYGVAYGTVIRAETGLTNTMPKPVKDVFAAIGEDADAACQQYAAWREGLRVA